MAQPLERQFAQIPGVAQITSVSVLGTTQITIQFDLDRNIDAAAGDVQAAINAASGQLPKNLPSPPTYRKVNPSDAPIMILAVQSDALPLIEVDDYADNVLSQQISQIAGVAQVFIGGEQKRAVRDAGRPRQARRHGPDAGGRARICWSTPRSTRRRAPSTASTDRSRSMTTTSSPRPRNTTTSCWRIATARRCGCKDIGHAIDGPENRLLAGWQNGKRGIMLMIFKQPGANVIDTVERIKAALPRLEASIPPSIHVSTIMDRTQTIRASVRRRAVHPDAVDLPGRDGDLPVPAQRLGHDHSRRSPCRWR